ncbi:MAG TPA: HAMP domain-containing histidine kinase, partial [Sulfurovum sp.]|nr:HAMP domain-containing histidine kinase [Sulfurovum sp.]
MDKQKRTHLRKFLYLYFASAFFLISIIGILYYQKESREIRWGCDMELQTISYRVFHDLQNDMFDAEKYTLKVGLFDDEQKVIFSNLDPIDLQFDQKLYESNGNAMSTNKLNKTINGSRYIIVQNPKGRHNMLNMQLAIALTVLVASVFIVIIGYFMSRILLKPYEDEIAHIDQFIKDSTHELNTPITALMMSVSALKKKGIKEKKLLNHISASSKLIYETFSSLSFAAFHDISEKEITTFDLQEPLLESCNFFKEIGLSKGISIHSHTEPLMIQMDKDSLKKLINNVISNAIKYGNTNSQISVNLTGSILSIADEGIGIK